MLRWLLLGIICVGSPLSVQAQTREEKVLSDRERVLAEGFWLYNDLQAGVREARRTGKPLLVTLRCIPCEECVKLDEELMENDPELRRLLEQFVRVRIVSTNGLDLSIFQFDTDQSFTVFMLDADLNIYGRYGTRSSRTEWIDDVSIEGLAAALEGALELHENPGEYRRGIQDKRGPEPEFARPELYPSLNGRQTNLLFQRDVVKNCIHCHQIGDAQRDHARSEQRPFSEPELFPYPHPKVVGLVIDPATRGTIKEVTEDSLAQFAGFQAGDEILSMNGQPILSIADMQWVLHHSNSEDEVEFVVERDGIETELTLDLPEGWKQAGDISWRVSTWNLRRMVTGGLVLKTAEDSVRRQNRVDPDSMAIVVEYVGQYGQHAAGKNAGFQKGDLIVAFDGRKDLLRETDLISYALRELAGEERVSVTIMRDGREMELELPLQR